MGAMRRWLKPTGFMSRQIDYRCHGKADSWNGHWTYSDAAWEEVIVGRRPYLLNRMPHSERVRLLSSAGVYRAQRGPRRAPSSLRRRQLAEARFRSLSDDDLSTCGAPPSSRSCVAATGSACRHVIRVLLIGPAAALPWVATRGIRRAGGRSAGSRAFRQRQARECLRETSGIRVAPRQSRHSVAGPARRCCQLAAQC